MIEFDSLVDFENLSDNHMFDRADGTVDTLVMGYFNLRGDGRGDGNMFFHSILDINSDYAKGVGRRYD